MKKILLIEDDANLAFMVTDGLESEGFDVFHMNNGEDLIDAMDEFIAHPPDIILLDVNLKGKMNGFELSKKIRQRSQVPIIFTTSRTQIEDIQEGFKTGNVDYLKKPFGIRELVLRMNEMLSRNQTAPAWNGNLKIESNKTYKIGIYLFNPAESNFQFGDEKIHLQKNESAVLKLLCENIGKVVTKNEILESVWNDEDLKQKEASMHNILSSLRIKLSKDENIVIETIPKIGWKFIVIS